MKLASINFKSKLAFLLALVVTMAVGFSCGGKNKNKVTTAAQSKAKSCSQEVEETLVELTELFLELAKGYSFIEDTINAEAKKKTGKDNPPLSYGEYPYGANIHVDDAGSFEGNMINFFKRLDGLQGKLNNAIYNVKMQEEKCTLSEETLQNQLIRAYLAMVTGDSNGKNAEKDLFVGKEHMERLNGYYSEWSTRTKEYRTKFKYN